MVSQQPIAETQSYQIKDSWWKYSCLLQIQLSLWWLFRVHGHEFKLSWQKSSSQSGWGKSSWSYLKYFSFIFKICLICTCTLRWKWRAPWCTASGVDCASDRASVFSGGGFSVQGHIFHFHHLLEMQRSAETRESCVSPPHWFSWKNILCRFMNQTCCWWFWSLHP